ncbi:hypothetical protein H9L25_00475 [Terrisporobacter mayombei]|nr:hypothetical protein [Terrisporobacter mayombei]
MKYKINKISNDVIDCIYENRGLTDEMVDAILDSDIENWEDTLNYKNIDRGYKRLMKSIENNDLIGVLVDP